MRRVLTGIGFAVGIAACGDTTEPGEHHEPAGLEIRAGAAVLVTVDGTTVTGDLTVAAGDESPDLTFVFLTENGDALTIADDEYLEIEVADEGVAEAHYLDQAGGTAHFDGVAAGTTTFQVRLMHGAIGTGHADYTSPPITIVVN